MLAALRKTFMICLIAVSLLTACTDRSGDTTVPDASAESADTGGGHEALASLFADFLAWRSPVAGPTAGAIDYGMPAVAARTAELEALQQRLGALDPTDWPRSQQVDFLAVRAQLDEQEFILRVTRPWARDPHFFVRQLLPLTFTPLPLSDTALSDFRAQLQALPELLNGATATLTAITRDHGEHALFNLTNADGVGQDHPARPTPPPGVLGWYADLAKRAAAAQPELSDDIATAQAAVQAFHDWLAAQRDSFAAESGVGEALLDWFIHHALLIPQTSAEILVKSERELERLRAFHALERHRNRGLPELTIASDEADYLQRIASTDALVREWLNQEEYISIPDFIPGDWQVMGYNVPWVERGTPPNFWEQIQYRDPAPDHVHAVLPGHRYDVWFERQSTHPIRKHIRDGVRYQGWADYIEESTLQLGLLDTRPRTRELSYIFLEWRAARAIGDIRNQWNDFTARETMDYWLRETPFMDEGVARNYAYLRPSPAHGLHYTFGHLQMRQLLADVKRQLGDRFVLKDFHDRFMASERVPITLIRYEMTGLDDEIQALRRRTPLTTLLR